MIPSRVSEKSQRDTDQIWSSILIFSTWFFSAGEFFKLSDSYRLDFWTNIDWSTFRKIYRHDWCRFQAEENLQKGTGNQSAIMGHCWTGAIQISCSIVRPYRELFIYINFRFYKGANGVVVVFDIGSRSSFEALRRWMSEIQENCDEIPRILGIF